MVLSSPNDDLSLDYDQYQSIVDFFQLEPQFFTWKISNGHGLDNEDKLEAFTTEFIESNLYNDHSNECVLALMVYNAIGYDDADNIIQQDYFVGDEASANAEAIIYADSYLDDIILPEIPVDLHFYFDTDRWIDDYLSNGRAEILGRYDGLEHSEIINGTEYFIYRL